MSSSFHADGAEALYVVLAARIEAELLEEHAAEIAQASWLQRWQILRRLEREVERRVGALMPNDALFLHAD